MRMSRARFLRSCGLAAAAAVVARRAWPSGPPCPTRAGDAAGRGEPVLDSQRFRDAVVAGDIDAVRCFLDLDPALRFTRDETGRSVFLLAYLAGHPRIATLFTERGLELDLVEAAVAGEWERVTEIGESAPGLVNADHPIGGTAMYAAALFGHGVPMFRLNFVGADPNANPRGAAGITPVRAAMNCSDPFGAERAAIYLIGNGGDVNAPQKDGDSVLHGAVLAGNPYLVEYVVRKGGRVDATDRGGRTPLDVALAAGRDDLAQILRNHQAIVRDMPRDDPRASRLAYDAGGAPYRPPRLERPATVLSRIVGVSHTDVAAVREIVGGDPDLAHAVATTAEMAVEASAHMARMTESVRFFLDHGAPLSLPTCLRMGLHDRARELLVEHPPRVRERGPHDFAITYYPSIGGGDVESAALLVEHGVDVNCEGQLGQTGLHWAARAGQIELVEFWLEHGADVDARLRDSHPRSPGATPLDMARAAQRTTVADLLVSRGARGGSG